MYNDVTNDFKTKVIDRETPQMFLLDFVNSGVFEFLSSVDGDFTTAPITIEDLAYTNQNIEFGCCPAHTLSCTLQNTDLRFSGYGFGEAQAYIGVVTAKTASTVSASGIFAEYLYGGINYTLWVNFSGETITVDDNLGGLSTYSMPADYVAAYVRGKYLYMVGETDTYVVDITDGTQTTEATAKIMAVKTSASIALWVENPDNSITLTYAAKDAVSGVYYDTTYELCPMGVFNIIKPKQTTTARIEINDAYDRMRKLDADASSFISQLVFPTTVQQLFYDICSDAGVPYNANSLTIPISENRIPSATYSYRDLLYYVAEDALCIARADRNGKMELVTTPDSNSLPVATIPDTQIMADGFLINDYYTAQITKMRIKDIDGNMSEYAVAVAPYENIYTFLGNPFLTYRPIMPTVLYDMWTYKPMTVDLTELDPSIDSNDIVMISYDGTNYYIPIMKQTIVWCGKTFGEYIATGDEYRQPETVEDIEAYNGYIANQPSHKDDSGSIKWVWQKFSNGLVILTGKRQMTLNINSPWGSVYTTSADAVTSQAYPFTFDSVPVCSATLDNSGYAATWLVNGNIGGTASATPSYMVAIPSSALNYVVNIVYLVIGFATT